MTLISGSFASYEEPTLSEHEFEASVVTGIIAVVRGLVAVVRYPPSDGESVPFFQRRGVTDE